MNTLLRLIEKQNIASILLVIITVLIFPIHNTSAQTTEPNLVFNVSSEQMTETLGNFQLSFEEVYLSQNLRTYLESKKSPLSACADEMWKLPQWQHAMGIVFVESTYGRFAKNNNIASIGGGPSSKTWRKYDNVCDAFKDLTKLLEKPMYKNRLNTCAKKIGVYVVPGSVPWRRGCEKVQSEMEAITIKAKVASEDLANQHLAVSKNTKELALAF